jgi:serine protease Do
MTKKIISSAILLFFIGCDQLPELPKSWKKSGSSELSGQSDLWKESDKKAESTTTIPWKGNAVAADTFIKISKKADSGVVNIGTTTTVKRKNPFDFGGPQGGSPFEDFFGDDLFKFFFGGPGGPEGRGQPQPREFKQASLGSGFIIHESGLIVTNNHVVDKADVITVTIGSDREYKAKIIGADPKTDVALIKIETTEKLEPLMLGDSDDLQVGEIVVAIGNPFGLSHTVTQGIVSAKERSIGFGPYDNFIQTDASINPGNSGGPLLNLNAEVVGINAAMQAQGQGIGFAIPINLAKNIITQLKETGSVTRGWLGVWIQKVDPQLSKSFGLKDAQGALVSKVQKDSPADKAGIRPGDVILKVNGKEIRDSKELPIYVAGLPVGKEIQIEYMRDKKSQTAKLKIGKLEEVDLKDATGKKTIEPADTITETDALGFRVSNISNQDREKGKLGKEVEGVIIEDIQEQGPSDQKGLQVGNVILEVNREKVKDVATYQKLIKSLKKGDSVMLLVRQDENSTVFVAFTL